MAEHNEIGKIGEQIARIFLEKQDFIIIDKNYRTPYGEIDLIAKKDNKIHFIEVKSVKTRDVDSTDTLAIQPEDNLTFSKWSKMLITIEQYKKHRDFSDETSYQIDLACVYINNEKRVGRVKLVRNIHKE